MLTISLNSVATSLQDVWQRVDDNNSIKQCGYNITMFGREQMVIPALNSVATMLLDVWLSADDNNSIEQCGYKHTKMFGREQMITTTLNSVATIFQMCG